MNTITINFIECDPVPANGYNLRWRVAGTSDPYTDEGNFTESPAIFTDSINPAGTCYEGFLQSDCTASGESGTTMGTAIPWATVCEESGVSPYTIRLLTPCLGIPSDFIIENGTAGDILVVRATFVGSIKRVGGTNTKADVYISSFDGTPGSGGSACYSDTAYHSFSITADSTITMTGDICYLWTSAVTHNSSSSMSSLTVAIISINGEPVNISASGCKGNSSGEPVC